MEFETFCNLCFLPSAICSCYSLPFHLPAFPEGDIFTFPDPAERQAWMSPTESIPPDAGPVGPTPQPILPAWEALIPPMNLEVPEAGVTEPPPRVVVATLEQVSAANRRRRKAVPGRFVCEFCPQDFTAKHNLRNHINSHFQRKTHRCTGGCGNTFGTRSAFIRHRKKCKAVPPGM
ncbi:uncharacterized protein LACBIDRAFT_299955 [Laccaria bicolor S238N-H82]|uniref:Predicted protein n=1 Tax=Laccaria bicolor (strain S238N-H82 / ATCC MYA-4686) TaxID=486041 RepID=B0DFQ8_LACBS|nr:uncharacterized protein LACBIDRAFT_299955 [Laccaria bicolor S238N-H82]EDR06502.1 predicted protein [Laccaria bicolor S238N-H82]|eukprot:XP_001882874.1 predicted protein [Laccaria bicolor S238N-H82]